MLRIVFPAVPAFNGSQRHASTILTGTHRKAEARPVVVESLGKSAG
jgi:hypothetical protein